MYSQSGQRFPDPAGVDGGFSLPGFPMTPRLQGQTLDGSFKASGKTVVITGGSQASCSHAIMRAYYMHGFAWLNNLMAIGTGNRKGDGAAVCKKGIQRRCCSP